MNAHDPKQPGSEPHTTENHGVENRRLDVMIDAMRAETPTAEQSAAARRRLMQRLAAEQAKEAASPVAPRRARVVSVLVGTPRRAFGSALGLAAAVLLILIGTALIEPRQAQADIYLGAGDLLILGDDHAVTGACPLRHTDVQADLVGLVGRVTVTQTFHNPSDEKIEAVYVFPLPENAAVDAMSIIVGGRRIVGRVLPRPEARQAYEQARAQGKVAGLLDQQRPNSFTQSVANIEPGAEVEVEISYVQTLKYEDGAMEFVYPMVVSPRYEPAGNANPAIPDADTSAAPTDPTISSPAASTLGSPAPADPPAARPGHDISLNVRVDSGLDIQSIECPLHEVVVERPGPARAVVALKDQREIPNRDFILRIETATDHIGDALLVQGDSRGAFFTLILEPPKWTAPEQIVPKEMIFVIDRSGSMNGWKIDKARAAMRKGIEGLTDDDTFNLLSFSGGLGRLFDAPQPATADNVTSALAYLDNMQSGGGTEMMPAIREALNNEFEFVPLDFDKQVQAGNWRMSLPDLYRNQSVQGIFRSHVESEAENAYEGPYITSIDGRSWLAVYDPNGLTANVEDGELINARLGAEHADTGWISIDSVEPIESPRMRIVGFMTDGQIGNDFEILDEVRRNAGATRVFAFGVGDSTNRFLLQGMGDLGRGAVEFIDSSVPPEDAAQRFFVRVHSPVLTDVSVDFGDLSVDELYPSPLPDLFSERPVMIHGRLNTLVSGDVLMPVGKSVTLRGRTADGAFERTVPFQASPASEHGSAIASLWARSKVEHLMRTDMQALHNNRFPDEIKQQIVALGVEFSLMTQFTSFVAVDDLSYTGAMEPRTVEVARARPADESAADQSEAREAEELREVLFTESSTQDKVSRVRADLRSLANGVESYFVDANGYPIQEIGGGAAGGAGEFTAGRVVDTSAPAQQPASDRFGSTSGASFEYSKGFNSGWILWSFGPDEPSSEAGSAINMAPVVDYAYYNPAIAGGVPLTDANRFDYPDDLDADALSTDPDAAVTNEGVIWSYYSASDSYQINDGDSLINNVAYDPTNGMTSNGGVYRVKEVGPSPAAAAAATTAPSGSLDAAPDLGEPLDAGVIRLLHAGAPELADRLESRLGIASADQPSTSLESPPPASAPVAGAPIQPSRSGRRPGLRIAMPVFHVPMNPMDIGTLTTATLVAEIVVWGTGERALSHSTPVVLALFADGTLIWSENRLEGGSPYRLVRIESNRIAELFARWQQAGLFNRDELRRNYFGPDSDWTAIQLRGSDGWLQLNSWHELFEANPETVVLSGSVQNLNGRDRAEVIAGDKPEFLAFRQAWSELKNDLFALIPPGDHQPLGPGILTFESVWIHP
jgi:hypothetical protein